MISAVLTDLAPRVDHADVVGVSDTTLSVTLADDGDIGLAEDQSATVQVRVAAGGRVGWAGGFSAEMDAVAAAAIRSAAVGDPEQIFFPAPAGLPEPVTRSLSGRTTAGRELVDAARRLKQRVGRRGRTVETWAEGSHGAVEVVNTRGVHVRYEVSVVGLGLEIRSPAGLWPPCSFAAAGTALPEESEIDAMVDAAEACIEAPGRDEPSLPAHLPVWFGPRAARALLAPVLARLVGETWLASRATWPVLDGRITIADDSLAPGRPGSRPVCDDGVPTRRLLLVDRGRAVAGVFDLRTGCRHGVPATGHGWRRGFSGSRTGFSNIDVSPGDASAAQLAERAALYVPDLQFGTAPDPVSGVFRTTAPWSFLVQGGEVGPRIDGVTVSGDVFELLARVVAVGADARWIGSARVPSLVLDGVAVQLR